MRFNRRVRLGKYKLNEKYYDVDAEIEIREDEMGPELSICGSVWNLNHSDHIAGGQINFIEYVNEPAYPMEKIKRLQQIHDRWHLNNMRAGCEHQRELGWRTCPAHYAKISTTEVVVDGLPIFTHKSKLYTITAPNCAGVVETANVNSWDHSFRCSLDALCKPCPVCGYKYGTKWLAEPLPDSIIEELKAWPDPVKPVLG